MAKPRVILHAGAPKTGTTSLAYYLKDHERLLSDAGVFFPHRFAMRGDVDPLYDHLVNSRHPSRECESINRAKDRLVEIVNTVGANSILMSNESVLGEAFDTGNPQFYPHAHRVAPILAEIFEGFTVSISFTVRSFNDFLPSYYVQLVRRGSVQSFAEFCDTTDLASVSWQRPIEALRQAFSEQNVEVFDYGDFQADAGAFAERLFETRLPIKLPRFERLGKARNRSFGGSALFINRQLNRLTMSMQPERKKAYHHNFRRLMRPLSRVLPGKKPALQGETKALLEKQYQADVDTLLGR